MCLCQNEFCKHYEFLISSSPKLLENCPKCGSKWVRIILYLFREPFSTLKLERAKDLSVFLSTFIKSALSLPVKAIPECVLTDGSQESQIDVYLETPQSAFECKVYEDREVTTQEKMINIYDSDCKKLIDKLCKLALREGYFVTNLSLDEQQISKLDDETKKLTRGKEVNVHIISGKSPDMFLQRLGNELKRIDEQLTRMQETTLEERVKGPMLKLPEKPKSREHKDRL